MKSGRLRPLTFTLIALCGCARPIRTGPIIDNYVRAECIPVTAISGMPGFARWDSSLKMADGGVVQVLGVQAPGGRIDVRFLADGATRVAADAGDYIYPVDVRVDAAHTVLHVKADGQRAVGSHPQTWLFEYDLRQKHSRDRARVNPAVLPRTCFESIGK